MVYERTREVYDVPGGGTRVETMRGDEEVIDLALPRQEHIVGMVSLDNDIWTVSIEDLAAAAGMRDMCDLPDELAR